MRKSPPHPCADHFDGAQPRQLHRSLSAVCCAAFDPGGVPSLGCRPSGLLTSAFFICYMVAAPFVGRLADLYPRRLLMVGGALLWSSVTLLTAITHSFETLFIRHTIIGIGEATFVTIAPAFLSDMFPEHRRGRVLSIFYLAIPGGTALGYLLGGHLGASQRMACSIPRWCNPRVSSRWIADVLLPNRYEVLRTISEKASNAVLFAD